MITVRGLGEGSSREPGRDAENLRRRAGLGSSLASWDVSHHCSAKLRRGAPSRLCGEEAGPGSLGLGRRGGNRLWGAGVGPQCAQPLQSSWTPFPGLPEVKHWCRSFPSAKEAAVRCATGTFARPGLVLTLATQESTFLPVPHLPAEAKPSSDPPESSCCLSSQSTYMAPAPLPALSPPRVISHLGSALTFPTCRQRLLSTPPEPIYHSPRPPSAAPTAWP